MYSIVDALGTVGTCTNLCPVVVRQPCKAAITKGEKMCLSRKRLFTLSGLFGLSASLAIPHRKSFAAIPSVSLVLLGHTNPNVCCHTNRGVKLPLFRRIFVSQGFGF